MKLKVTRADGTQLDVEGTAEEVGKLLRDESLVPADAWPLAPPFNPHPHGLQATWPFPAGTIISSGTILPDQSWRLGVTNTFI